MKIKELLKDPKKWTQGTFAKDKDGLSTSSYSQFATCYCLFGAMNICYPDNNMNQEVVMKLKKFLHLENSIQLSEWNDNPTRTHQEVLDLVTILDV